MNVIIVGGTGFLGYHTALECLRHGHNVTAVALPDIRLGDWFPTTIKVIYRNVFDMAEDALIALFEGFDALVYAVGPDDRILPQAPALDFFHTQLVIACTQVMKAAQIAGIRKAVIAGSYFTYFDRLWPDKGIAQNNPYVKCRQLQAVNAIAAGGDTMTVSVLELPFIFGTMPERIPLWKDVIVNHLRRYPLVLFPRGGTSMISVQGVAQAFRGAIEYGKHGHRYIVGDVNMTYRNMLELMMEGLGISKTVISLPTPVAIFAGSIIKLNHRSSGRESGLDPVHTMKHLLSENLYFPSEELEASQKALNYTGTDIRQAIYNTMQACQP